jgi:hypothetical protein
MKCLTTRGYSSVSGYHAIACFELHVLEYPAFFLASSCAVLTVSLLGAAEFVQVWTPSNLKMRVWERGAGKALSLMQYLKCLFHQAVVDWF